MKKQEILERNLIDALINKNYEIMERILSVAFNPFNYDRKEYDTDTFILALEFNDPQAVESLFKGFKKWFTKENIAKPSEYVQTLVNTDNKEIYDIIKKHGFLDAFKESLTMSKCVLAMAPHSLKVALNEFNQKLEDNNFALNTLCTQIISMNYYGQIPDNANRLKETLEIFSKNNFNMIEEALCDAMLNLTKYKENNKYQTNFIYREEFNEFIYAFLETGIDPFKKFKEYNVTHTPQIEEKLKNNPEIQEINFFDLLFFDETKVYVEKKFLESKLTTDQVLFNDLPQEVKLKI